MQGIHPRPMNENLQFNPSPGNYIHIKIRKLCSNVFHLGEEFKIDHLEIILDYTSLVRSKLITVHVPGHPGQSIVQYFDQTEKLVPKVIA